MHKVKQSEWATQNLADFAKKLVKEKSSVPLTFVIHTYHDERRVFAFFPDSEEQKQLIYRYICFLLKLWDGKYYGIISEGWATNYQGDIKDYPYSEVRLDPNRYDILTVAHVSRESARMTTYKITKKRQLKIDQLDDNPKGKVFSFYSQIDKLVESMIGQKDIPTYLLTDERRAELEKFAIKQMGMKVELELH